MSVRSHTSQNPTLYQHWSLPLNTKQPTTSSSSSSFPSSSSLTHSSTVHPTNVRMVSYVLLSDFFSSASKQTFGLWKVGRRLHTDMGGARGRVKGGGSIVKDDLLSCCSLALVFLLWICECRVYSSGSEKNNHPTERTNKRTTRQVFGLLIGLLFQIGRG